MSNESVIDLRTNDETTWDRQTDQTHRFKLLKFNGLMLEAEDQRFHYGGAVFMPDYNIESISRESGNEFISGLAVLRACYLHAKDNPSQKAILVGHTDTTGPESYNSKLSQKRSENLLALLAGDRNCWVTIADKYSKTEDYQQILKWVARIWGISCDPGEVDNKLGSITKRAIRLFQAWYNKEFEKSITVDGIVGKQTWCAFFDVYMKELSYLLETDETGLNNYRTNLKFISDNCKASGAGESFPIDSPRLEEYRSETNRRVEVLFFEPEDEPRVPSGKSTNSCPPELEIIYNPNIYHFETIEVEPAPSLVWIDLQTVDELGLKAPNIELQFDPEYAEPFEVSTDENGYWSGRVRVNGKIKITMGDGRSVKFGADKGETEDTVVLIANNVGRTIRDIVVPVLPKEIIDERKKLIERHGRNPSTDDRSTTRSGGPVKYKGEKAQKVSSRGGEVEKYTRRRVGKFIADNICIAAGWDESNFADKLCKFLHDWLVDHHPSAIARGYFIQIIVGEYVLFYDKSHKFLSMYKFTKGMGIAQGQYGAYCPFEFFRAQQNALFVDMTSQTGGFAAGHLATIKESLKKRLQKDDEEKEDIPKEGENEQADKVQGFVDFIFELIEEGKREEYRKLAYKHIANQEVEIVYIFPTDGNLIYLARSGGTGLLEDYPKDDTLRKRIHDRNLQVARNIKAAYELYVRWYIEDVKKLPTKAKKGDPHPEVQLYRIGPPDSAFVYPKPAGATIDEYREILSEGGASALQAWMEIANKLNAIWGQRAEGSIWMVVDFSAEAGYFAGAGVFSGASVKLNFEVDEDFKIKAKGEKEVPLTLVQAPSSAGLPGNVKYSKKLDDKTGREITQVNFSIGKYGVEADSDGNVKFSAGTVFSQWNQATAEGGYGLDFSLKNFVAEHFAKDKGMDKAPDWVGDLPDLKIKVGLYFKLVTQGTLLKIISRSPGFFQMRPRTEFISLDWESLDWDEQKHLEVLGWGEIDPSTNNTSRWNTGNRPDTAKKQFFVLTAEQKLASTKIPVPTSDPYWLQFWYSFEQKRLSM